ncbi:hypothetical protein BGX34_010139 [Mortierella sp. NVP85]|nr:hypothetical protein BGX34_010139 [Mortierella sp. NVP85]
MPPPSIGQREDQYRYSSQSVASTPYQAYFPYSVQNPLPSPSFKDKHRTSSNYSSPRLVPLYSPNHPYEEQQQSQRPSEHKTDPYRSAYSQSSNHQLSNQSHGSLHQASSKGSPNPNDDFSSSYESRFSGTGQQQQQLQQQQSNSGNNDARYPMRDLAGQNSSQALSASFYEMEDLDLDSSKKPSVKPLDKDHSATISNSAKHSLTRPSSVHPAQPFKADPSGSKKDITTEEDEDNDVILQKLGVLNADNASRSTGSGRSRPKSHWTDGSDEEAQRRPGSTGRRGANGRRNGRQAQTPSFQYEAISPNGPPIVTNDRIRETFTFHFRVDNSNNYLPMRLNAINMAVVLKLDQTKIADNDHLPSSYVIQPRTIQEITVPMTLDYKSPTSDLTSDGTLQYLVHACMPLHKMENGALPPGLDITITGELQVWGLSWLWKPAFTIDVDDVPCPVNAKSMAAASEATSETTSETIARSVSS